MAGAIKAKNAPQIAPLETQKIVILLGLLGFIVMADNWVVSPILPAIAETLGIPVQNAGLLITAYMIPFGLFQLIFGPMADRFGKKQILTFSIVFFTIATGLCAIAGSLENLAFYRALTGVFAASVMPISMAFTGQYLGLLILCIGTAIGGKMAAIYGFPTLFLICGIMLGITLLASFFLIHDPEEKTIPIPESGI